jgi:chromate reductase, NAD(P)H dehydrogenase (quinone)
VAALIGLSGSLRRASYNTALLRAAASMLPEGTTLQVCTPHGIPLYDGDLQAEGMPPAVSAMKELVAAADGLILATPEYNHSVPGVLKNTIDWLTRPPSDIARVFAGKPVALIGATPGGFGTILGQNAWLPVLRALRMRLWTDERLQVSRAASVIDATGAIVDPRVAEQLRQFVAGFAAFADRARSGR